MSSAKMASICLGLNVLNGSLGRFCKTVFLVLHIESIVIIWSNAVLLSIGPLGTRCTEIVITIE